MRVKISDNINEVMEDLNEELEAYQRNFSLQIWRALGVLEAQVLQNIRRGSGLHVRTGRLLNSIGASKKVVELSNGTTYGELGPEGVQYAAIQEFGGTIVPKNKQWLTIPSDENRRPDGLPRMTVQDLLGLGKGKSFISKNTIFMKDGADRFTPMFFLKKSVTIPARPYLRPALAQTQDKILKDFGLFIQASFKKE